MHGPVDKGRVYVIDDFAPMIFEWSDSFFFLTLLKQNMNYNNNNKNMIAEHSRNSRMFPSSSLVRRQ